MLKPRDFFLPGKPGAFDEFRGPQRTATEILPLIDASEIFADQEKAILDAKRRIFLASWSFNPELETLHDSAKALADNWGELLVYATSRGVAVNVFVTDFDPFFYDEQHELVWKRWIDLVNYADHMRVPEKKFQLLVARHEAEWTPEIVLNQIVRPKYAEVLTKLNSSPKRAWFKYRPGLWDKVEFKEQFKLRNPETTFPLIVGSFHQKLLIIDEAVAYISAINHVPENSDDRRHALLKDDMKWHDGCVRVRGPVLEDIIRGAYGMWNSERLRTEAFIIRANKHAPSTYTLPSRFTEKLTPMARSGSRKPGVFPCQAWRTMSRAITSSDNPDTVCSDIFDGFVNAIGRAESFIYIENQYLRDVRIGQALTSRLIAKKDLNVIIVLPPFAEEMLKAKEPDQVTVTGAALQYGIIKKLQKQERFAAFTMLAPLAPHKDNEQRKDVIYVHNKVMIIDDVFATMGSANLNARSTRLDAELNLAWHDPNVVKLLRWTLWREILGGGIDFIKWKPASFVKNWTDLARKNEAAGWQRRNGFVMPLRNPKIGGLPLPDWLALADEVAPDRRRPGGVAPV